MFGCGDCVSRFGYSVAKIKAADEEEDFPASVSSVEGVGFLVVAAHHADAMCFVPLRPRSPDAPLMMIRPNSGPPFWCLFPASLAGTVLQVNSVSAERVPEG